MPTQSIRSAAVAVCLLTMFAPSARAQFRPRPVATTSPAETYHVELGAGFWNPTADMQIASGPGGSSVDLKNDLGLQDKKFGEFQLVVKAALKHKIRVQFIPISYTQTGTPRSSFILNNQTSPAGAAVSSSLEWKAWR